MAMLTTMAMMIITYSTLIAVLGLSFVVCCSMTKPKERNREICWWSPGRLSGRKREKEGPPQRAFAAALSAWDQEIKTGCKVSDISKNLSQGCLKNNPWLLFAQNVVAKRFAKKSRPPKTNCTKDRYKIKAHPQEKRSHLSTKSPWPPAPRDSLSRHIL